MKRFAAGKVTGRVAQGPNATRPTDKRERRSTEAPYKIQPELPEQLD